MFSKKRLTFLIALSVPLMGISCGKTHAHPQLDSTALLQIVRGYNPNSHAGTVMAATRPVEPPMVSPTNLQTEFEYKSPIKQYFSQGNFEQLEKVIGEAREGKGRLLGGTWKVLDFYFAIHETFLVGNPDESDWKMYFDTLNQWVAAKPESAAARISLAQAYVGYAWRARGGGYANSVTAKGWELFNERVAMGSNALADAARLKEKCPYWYSVMQTVALAQGWDKSQTRELMEQAVTFEPDYYHFYREYANSLQTKWYGEEGEIESFAEEVSDRVGSQKGDVLYFEIASLVACQCDAEKTALHNMSWPRIKRGYATLGQLYGVSALKRNRFASMAVKAGDKQAARDALVEMGAEWDKDVWISSAKFESAKSWAMND
jgi:hypothetical protein